MFSFVLIQRTGNNMKSERTTLTSLGVNIGKSDYLLKTMDYLLKTFRNWTVDYLLKTIRNWTVDFLSLITMSSDYIFKVHHCQGLQISYKQLSSCWSVGLLYICDLHTELGMESTTMYWVGGSEFAPSSYQAVPRVRWDNICECCSNAGNVLYPQSMYCRHYILANTSTNSTVIWTLQHPGGHSFLVPTLPWNAACILGSIFLNTSTHLCVVFQSRQTNQSVAQPILEIDSRPSLVS